MADNDRFVIIRENELIITSSDIYQIKQLDKFIKTRAEYEDMITKTLIKHKIKKSGRGLNNHTIGEIYDIRTECKKQAKAVVSRLFGEGE